MEVQRGKRASQVLTWECWCTAAVVGLLPTPDSRSGSDGQLTIGVENGGMALPWNRSSAAKSVLVPLRS